MQLSQTAEYALRAIIWLAQNIGNPQTAQQIATGCKMPAGYLAKVLQPLARAGLVSAQRGLGGGYVMERDPGSLSLLEVIAAVEPIQRIRTCPLKIGAHGSRLCALHQTLDDALAQIEKTLGDRTIGELVTQNNAVQPLCETVTAAIGLTVGGAETSQNIEHDRRSQRKATDEVKNE